MTTNSPIQDLGLRNLMSNTMKILILMMLQPEGTIQFKLYNSNRINNSSNNLLLTNLQLSKTYFCRNHNNKIRHIISSHTFNYLLFNHSSKWM